MRELWKPKKTCYSSNSNTCLTVVNQIFETGTSSIMIFLKWLATKEMTRYFVWGRLTDYLQEGFIISMMMMMMMLFWSEC
jgi:hypothetical protein